MEAVVTGTRIQTPRSIGEYNNKYVAWMCVMFSALILGRAMSDVFFYAFAGISLLVFVISSTQHCVSFLLFLLPFSSILKQDVDSMSFFTILFFLLIAKMVLTYRKIDVRLLICLLIFLAYNLIFSGLSAITANITMMAGILMLYYLKQEKIDVNGAVVTYAVGICIASVLALLKEELPIVNSFITDVTLRLGDNTYATRFTGLQGNPNYYTLDIIVALSAIVVLMYQNKPKKIYTVGMIALSVFGLMSVSKSFLVAWVLLIVCWFFLSVKQGAGKMVRFVFVMILGVAVVYYFAYDAVNTYLLRFWDEGGSADSLTTGRTEIWAYYLEAIFSDMKILFVGNGLLTMLEPLKRGAHNTFLECLFSLGLLGTLLLITSVGLSAGNTIPRKILWVPVLMLVVRMLAIGILTYDNIWFYFGVLLLLAKECGTQKPLDIVPTMGESS